MKKVIIFFIGILTFSSAHAILYSSISNIVHAPAYSTNCGNFTEGSCIDFNLLSWTSEEDSKVVNMQGSRPSWILALYPEVNGVVGVYPVSGFCTINHSNITVGDLRRECPLKKSSVYSGSTIKTGDRICLRIAYPGPGSVGYLVITEVTTECYKAPPPNIKCDLGGPVNIDFGSLDSDSLTGKTATTSVRATCSSNISATVKAVPISGGSTVDLLPGLKATLTVDNIPGSIGSTKTVGSAGTDFVLGAELTSSGVVAPGKMNGTAFISITMN